jgi:radical SAM superfamily enzyme YgiQ (UPF0313 family)
VSQAAFTFVFPSVLNGRIFDGFDYHLGTGYLRAYLAKHGVDSFQFLGRCDRPIRDIAAEILDLDAAMIGFSCYDANYYLVRLLANEIRKQSPHVSIVFGGPSATFSDRLIMSDCTAVDICCRSYAERTSLELVEWSRGEMQLDSISGITFRRNGEIRRNDDRRAVPRPKVATVHVAAFSGATTISNAKHHETGGELDQFPDPYILGLLPPERVSDIGLVTSRGCTYSCTFCNFSAMSGRSVATHSLQHQMSVFHFLNDALRDRGTKTLVTINDDNFSLQSRRFHELLRLMADATFENLTFWAEMRTEPLREDTFRLLREAGFEEVNFGLESAVPSVLAAMKKVRSSGWERDNYDKEKRFLERIAWAVGRSRAEGIRTTVSVIFGGPTETLADGKETLKYIQRIEVDSYAHNFMVVGDGTELAETYEKYGLKNVTPPDRVLPPITRMTYDVYTLPILEHDRSWLHMSGFEMRQANLLIAGTGNLPGRGPRPRGNGRGGMGRWLDGDSDGNSVSRPGAVVAVPETLLDETLAQWLAYVLPINSSIWLLQKGSSSKRSFQELFNRAGVPVPELNTMREVTSAAGNLAYRINEFSEDAPEYNTRIIHFIPFHKITTGAFRKTKSGARGCFVYVVDSHSDLSALLQVASGSASLNEWTFSPELVAARSTFQDSCRWCSAECPAKKLDRLLVSDDQSVRPCTNASPVGRVGQTLGQIGEQIAALEIETRRERGCEYCSAQDTCAKCIFTAPFTVDEYCAAQRSRPTLSGLFDGLVMIRSLLDNGLIRASDGPYRLTSLRPIREGELRGNGIQIPLRDCVLLSDSANEVAFIYCHKQEFLAGIESEHCKSLRVLVACSDGGNYGEHVHALSIDLGNSIVGAA